MRCRRGFAALLVLLSLGGCAQAVVGQGQASHAPPYSYGERGDTRGGGGEGSSGM